MTYKIKYNNSLSHHGVLGMKWGVWNDETAARYRGGSRNSKETKERLKPSSYSPKETTEKLRSKSSGPLLKNDKFGLNRKQQRLLSVGVAAAGIALSAGAVIALNKLDGGDASDLVELGKAAAPELLGYLGAAAAIAAYNEITYSKDKKDNINNNVSFNEINKIKSKHNETQDMAAINPSFEKDMSHQMNCVLCTTAYELRRRGYDVEANTTKKGRSTKDAGQYFNIKEKDIFFESNYNKFKDALESQPEGSRGNVLAQCGPYLANHSMVWEKQGGKIIIRDCQSNKVYNSIEESPINSKSKNNNFFRTDNLEINEEVIMDAVRKRGA